MCRSAPAKSRISWCSGSDTKLHFYFILSLFYLNFMAFYWVECVYCFAQGFSIRCIATHCQPTVEQYCSKALHKQVSPSCFLGASGVEESRTGVPLARQSSGWTVPDVQETNFWSVTYGLWRHRLRLPSRRWAVVLVGGERLTDGPAVFRSSCHQLLAPGPP